VLSIWRQIAKKSGFSGYSLKGKKVIRRDGGKKGLYDPSINLGKEPAPAANREEKQKRRVV